MKSMQLGEKDLVALATTDKAQYEKLRAELSKAGGAVLHMGQELKKRLEAARAKGDAQAAARIREQILLLSDVLSSPETNSMLQLAGRGIRKMAGE